MKTPILLFGILLVILCVRYASKDKLPATSSPNVGDESVVSTQILEKGPLGNVSLVVTRPDPKPGDKGGLDSAFDSVDIEAEARAIASDEAVQKLIEELQNKPEVWPTTDL